MMKSSSMRRIRYVIVFGSEGSPRSKKEGRNDNDHHMRIPDTRSTLLLHKTKWIIYYRDDRPDSRGQDKTRPPLCSRRRHARHRGEVVGSPLNFFNDAHWVCPHKRLPRSGEFPTSDPYGAVFLWFGFPPVHRYHLTSPMMRYTTCLCKCCLFDRICVKTKLTR